MVDVEKQLLLACADKHYTRDDVALTYAYGLRCPDEVDWVKVNHAIIERWSKSALKYIKARAWRRRDFERDFERWIAGRADDR